jgi:peptide/nickel transport system permease protein
LYRYILIRILRAIATLWIVVTVVFFGMRISSDPVRLMLGDNASPDDIVRLRAAYGLDESTAVQYLTYLSRLGSGDFGSSLAERRPVTTVIREKLPATLELAGWSIAASLLLGIPFGLIAAVRRNSLVDRFVIGVSFIGQAVPGFFIAVLLIYLFTIYFGVLPSSGRGDWRHLVLPVIALGWGSMATVARITRVAVLDVLNADYVRTARAKGLRERSVLVGHVLRTASIPVLTMLGFLLGAAVAGAITIEKVFAWPGMGRVLEGAVLGRDFPLIQATVLLIAASVVTVNLIVDLAYGLIDPRVGR